MDKDILIALIGSGSVIALLKLLTPPVKKILSILNSHKVRASMLSSTMNSESMMEHMVYIGQKFHFNYSHVVKFHDGGTEIHELSIKKITITYEFPIASHLTRKKQLWYDRAVDVEFNKMIKFLLKDRNLHIEDIEHIEPNTGIRKIYNKANGGELLLVELGIIGVDYYFMCFQRDRKTHSTRATPVLLSDGHLEEIQYRCKNIWDLCKNAKR
jgi:hypothetical protein